MLRLACEFSSRQGQVDPMLGDALDVGRIDETRAMVSRDHDAVEDIFFFDREHLLDLPDSLSITVITSSSDCQRFIRDRGSGVFVHRTGT